MAKNFFQTRIATIQLKGLANTLSDEMVTWQAAVHSAIAAVPRKKISTAEQYYGYIKYFFIRDVYCYDQEVFEELAARSDEELRSAYEDDIHHVRFRAKFELLMGSPMTHSSPDGFLTALSAQMNGTATLAQAQMTGSRTMPSFG